jgi:LacI family transcriptional regulator
MVGIAVDAAMGHGRSILRGAMRYANVRRRWLIHEELRITGAALEEWPPCDGVLMAVANCPLADQIRERFRHVVSCSGGTDPAQTPVVRSDDVAIGHLAAEHLIGCQLKHFGFYGRASPAPVSEDREAGFSAALKKRGHTFSRSPVDWPQSYSWTDRHHWPGLIRWIDGLPKPVGIFALDDASAHDLAAASLEAGVGVPDRVAILGVNNDDLLCDSAWPPLSSVITEPTRIGYEAARLLDVLLAGGRVEGAARVTRIPPVGLARRASTDVLAVDQPQVAAAVRFIRERACDPCSVGNVLDEVAVNRRWLERQFARHLGHSLHDAIIRARVEAARAMLLQTDASLPAVAERCGFGTVQTFGRQFLAIVGDTPAAWRRSSRQSNG